MKILGIGSHPDDLEFGCGGTFAKFSKAGHQIHMLIVTSGEIGGEPAVRRREQERSARILKAKTYWGGFRDTDIPLTRELIQMLERHIRDIKPNLIFTHHFDDTHQDHRKVSQATTTAARHVRNVLYFEVPSTLNFNPSVYVDIGTFLPRKLAVLKAHRSQVFQTKVPDLTILESAKSTAVFRGYQDRVKYAEAFVPMRLSLDFAA
ncbi:MAG: PIG-L family deacetylase [Elusimicrobia bacterium]|nr:PIG-L family deacetylase [Elusimicrobiota bacterium]